MTETRQRVLQPSYSFSSTSSAELDSHSYKRRLTPDTLFASSASATSLGNQSAPDSRSFSGRRDMAHIILPMDPAKSDHNAVFIHPPFTSFPDAHKYPQGLTYAIMADHPDWFLDSNDFASPVNLNPLAICYPAQLEPPRGWCPAKKKDLKERGCEGWPEGEEPRLRCTFCRRTYAGVNAKSMWRRHVYEKHKIAMANRRDNTNPDRSRRRGSTKIKESDNKENRKREKRSHDSGSDSDTSRDEKFVHQNPVSSENMPPPLSIHSQEEKVNEPIVPQPSSSTLPSQSTPFTPHSLGSKIRNSLMAASPYDPLVTPTFRHSTPRLPSDQPWRFPSPSHPLHSTARELSLATVVRGEATSVFPNVLDISPVVFGPRTDVIDSPTVPIPPGGNRGFLQLNGSAKRTPGFPKPSPRKLFSLPTPLQPRRWQLPDSPFAHNLRTSKGSGSSLLSLSSSSGESDPLLSPISRREGGLLEPIRLAGDDPFTDIYNSWLHPVNEAEAGKTGARGNLSPPTSSPEDSPVVRSGPLPIVDGTFEGERLDTNESVAEDDFVLMHPGTPEVGSEIEADLTQELGRFSNEWLDDHAWDEIAPPSKRRRIEAHA